ncbi:hypothetical protein MMC22_009593 [Lobaria immixta]|nr:hypothetical protein [Lobaria immixta]
MSTNQDGDETKSGERFAHRFETEKAGIEKLIDQVKDNTSIVTERGNVINQCFMGIARLSDDVGDASRYTTAYEQRLYSQAINSLRQKLEAASRSQAPRQKFTFKNRPSKASSVTAANRTLVTSSSPQGHESAQSSTGPADFNPLPLKHSSTFSSGPLTLPPPSVGSASSTNLSSHPADPASSATPASSLIISYKTEVHIIPPPSSIGPSSPVSIEEIDRSVIDLSGLIHPCASLTMVNISRSVIICGIVDSAALITNVRNSVLVISSLQVRMHKCSDCIVYLRCHSKPLFEGCTNMKLAPLPAVMEPPTQSAFPNQWDHPDDFSWLHPGPSPNWSVLAPRDRIPDPEWRTMASRYAAEAVPVDNDDDDESTTERILHRAGVL